MSSSGIVASAKEFQGDYERRLRELRMLGWDYKPLRKYGEGARVRVYYQLVRSAPWPENIRAAITAEENRRKAGRPGTKGRDWLRRRAIGSVVRNRRSRGRPGSPGGS